MYRSAFGFLRRMFVRCQGIAETLKRCCIDICCLQEVRWGGKGAKMIGNEYKLLLSVGSKTENGVGVMVGNWLVEKIV